MWKPIYFFFALVGLAASFVQCAPENRAVVDSIITAAGGNMEDDTKGRYRAVGQIIYIYDDGSTKPICSATLISRTRIATAGHCYYGPATYAFRTYGTDGNTTDWPIETFGVHQNYYYVEKYDVGLAILAGNGVTDSTITPLSLSESAASIGDKITVIGFGKTSQTAMDQNTRRFGQARVAEVFDNHFFFGQATEDAFLCLGDSGGPSLNAASEIVGIHTQSNCENPTHVGAASQNIDTAVVDLTTRQWLLHHDTPMTTIPNDARYRLYLAQLSIAHYADLATTDRPTHRYLICENWGAFVDTQTHKLTGITDAPVPLMLASVEPYVFAEALLSPVDCVIGNSIPLEASDWHITIENNRMTESDLHFRQMRINKHLKANADVSATILVQPAAVWW